MHRRRRRGQLVLGEGVVEGGEAQVVGQAAPCRADAVAPVDVEQLDPLEQVAGGVPEGALDVARGHGVVDHEGQVDVG